MDLRLYEEARYLYGGASRGFVGVQPQGAHVENHYHCDVFDDASGGGCGESGAVEELAAQGYLCELQGGEALYIPETWAHAVLSTPSEDGLSIAVNVWFMSAETAWQKKLHTWGFSAVGILCFYFSIGRRKGKEEEAADLLSCHPRCCRRRPRRPASPSPCRAPRARRCQAPHH